MLYILVERTNQPSSTSQVGLIQSTDYIVIFELEFDSSCQCGQYLEVEFDLC